MSWPASAPPWRASHHGMTRLLLTIVDTATVSTMTMPVAADRPPMKASIASHGWSCMSGR